MLCSTRSKRVTSKKVSSFSFLWPIRLYIYWPNLFTFHVILCLDCQHDVCHRPNYKKSKSKRGNGWWLKVLCDLIQWLNPAADDIITRRYQPCVSKSVPFLDMWFLLYEGEVIILVHSQIKSPAWILGNVCSLEFYSFFKLDLIFYFYGLVICMLIRSMFY
jgi:hypothetical protein